MKKVTKNLVISKIICNFAPSNLKLQKIMKVFQKAVQVLAVIGACHSLFTMELGGCVFYGILIVLFAFFSDEDKK